MPRKNTKKESGSLIEFEFEGKEFSYSGRLYPDNAKETKKCTIIPLSLCLNKVFTIKGMKLWRSDKNSWLTGPSYQSGDDYKDYLYIDKDFSDHELDNLIAHLEELLDKQ